MVTNSNGADTQGVEARAIKEMVVPNVETIEKWLERDVAVCISLLTAIQQDKELKQQMAIWLEGRYTNYQAKKKFKEGGENE